LANLQPISKRFWLLPDNVDWTAAIAGTVRCFYRQLIRVLYKSDGFDCPLHLAGVFVIEFDFGFFGCGKELIE
jgi:hypothetical protein